MPPAKSVSRSRVKRGKHRKNATASAARKDRPPAFTVEPYPFSSLPEPIPWILRTRVDKADIAYLSETAVEISSVVDLAIFPNRVLAVEPSSVVAMLDEVAYCCKNKQWLLGYPALDLSPAHRSRSMATFLDHLTRLCWLAHVYHKKPTPAAPRQWVSTQSARLLPDDSVAQVPGLALVDTGVEAHWRNVLCDVQMAPTADRMAEVVDRLSTGAANVFDEQQDRLHHIGIAFAGDAFQVAYYDRAGCVLSGVYNVHEDANLFIRTIMGLTISGSPYDGKDTSIVTRDDRRFVSIGGVEYEIIETLSSSPGVGGSGTICWRCRRDDSDEDFVIKNTWADKALKRTEGEYLKKAQRNAGTPTLVCEERVLRPDGQPWTTTSVRDLAEGSERWSFADDLPKLELRRLVLQPLARPLADFSSKEEFVGGVRDAITAHEALYRVHDILHCDVSEDNIMLRHYPGSSRRRGLLIDFDHAADVSGDTGTVYSGHPKGTLPFVACDILQTPRTERHGPQHDLESFLYVIMFVCTKYSGPSNTPREDFDIRSSPLRPWLDGDVDKKEKIMFQYEDEEFRAFLDSTFDPYFDDLKDLVCDLRTTIMRPQGWTPSHAAVLVHIDDFLEERQDEREKEEAAANEFRLQNFAKPQGTGQAKQRHVSSSTPESSGGSDSLLPASPMTPTLSPQSSATSASEEPDQVMAQPRRRRGAAELERVDLVGAGEGRDEAQTLRRSKRRKVA